MRWLLLLLCLVANIIIAFSQTVLQIKSYSKQGAQPTIGLEKIGNSIYFLNQDYNLQWPNTSGAGIILGKANLDLDTIVTRYYGYNSDRLMGLFSNGIDRVGITGGWFNSSVIFSSTFTLHDTSSLTPTYAIPHQTQLGDVPDHMDYCRDSQGFYYFVGRQSDTITIGNASVSCYSPSGFLVWERFLNASNLNFGFTIELLPQNHLFVGVGSGAGLVGYELDNNGTTVKQRLITVLPNGGSAQNGFVSLGPNQTVYVACPTFVQSRSRSYLGRYSWATGRKLWDTLMPGNINTMSSINDGSVVFAIADRTRTIQRWDSTGSVIWSTTVQPSTVNVKKFVPDGHGNGIFAGSDAGIGYALLKISNVGIPYDAFNDPLVGLANPIDNPLFKVYPNPSTDWIAINLPEDAQAQISLVTTSGQQVLSVDTKGHEKIPVSHLPAGLYTYRIRRNGGGTQYGKVFI